MTRLISSLFILIVQAGLGQSLEDKLILTQEQNENWISEIKKWPTDRQLELLRNRILSDTNVYVRSSAPDRIKIGDESQGGKKQESFGRPLIVLSGQCDHYPPSINNLTNNSSIIRLVSFLTVDNIDQITILTDDKAMAIYGSRAAAGVFILTLNKKKICKAIKKIDLGQ